MEKISVILKKIRPDADFAKSANFIEDGLLDSLDIIHLVDELEKNYSISVGGADIIPENFSNLDSIKALIKKLQSNG